MKRPGSLLGGRRTAAVLALLAASSIAAAAHLAQGDAWELELKTPAPVENELPERLDDIGRISCTACHETIADEWAQTLHALAWEDSRYQESLKGRRRKESCYGCHVPKPLHLAPPERFGRKPKPRTEEEESFHFGVSCKSCHLGPDGTILGPRGTETDAHVSVKSDHFGDARSNALCISCHQTTVGPVIGIAKDFLASRLEERGMSCVGCHMAPVERAMATDDFDEPTPVRKGRSHLLQTPRDPAFLAQTFAPTVVVEGGKTRVTIANRAGHRVPGLQERRIVFQAELLDAGGEKVTSGELVIDARAFLPVLGSAEITLEGTGASVRLVGEHFQHGEKKGIEFVNTVLAP